jgi:hypothetical protein
MSFVKSNLATDYYSKQNIFSSDCISIYRKIKEKKPRNRSLHWRIIMMFYATIIFLMLKFNEFDKLVVSPNFKKFP